MAHRVKFDSSNLERDDSNLYEYYAKCFFFSMDICHDFSAFKNFLDEEEKRRRRRKRRKIVDENINLDKLVQIIVTVTESSTRF